MMTKYYLTQDELNVLRENFQSDEEFEYYLKSAGIEAYESREAFDLRMDLQERINAQPWTANTPNTGLTWEKQKV